MKTKLIQHAKEAGFKSDIISDEIWKYSPNEELRWLFWMTALQKWLRDRFIHIQIELVNDMDGAVYIAEIYKHVGVGEIFDKSLEGNDIYEKIPTNVICVTMSSNYEEVLEEALYESLKLIKPN